MNGFRPEEPPRPSLPLKSSNDPSPKHSNPSSSDPSPKNTNPNGSTAPRFSDGYVLNGRWVLKRRIGQGRYSDVYVAISRHCSSEERREVAIKVEKENIPSEGRLLKWEATVLTDIQDCPYVCKMHESGVLDDGGFYIVMDLCSETLSECRKRQIGGQFRPHKGAAAAMSMLNCIEAVHRSGYVHRDIKPSNFVRPLKNAKNARKSLLIDFGLARRHHKNGIVLPARALGEFRGTSKYASLNSHSCKELGPRDDMFSFLFVVVDFVLGKLPWVDCTSRSEVATMKRKLFGRDFVRTDYVPDPIYHIAQHLNTLRFHDAPDYNLIRNALQELCNKRSSLQFIPRPPSDSPVKIIPEITDVLSPVQLTIIPPITKTSSPERCEIKSYCEACFTQRICEDRDCTLLHPPYNKAFVFPNMIPLPLCLEFIRGDCRQTNCPLYHWTEAEESVYLNTGSLPAHSFADSPVSLICLPSTEPTLPVTSPRSISNNLSNPQAVVPSPEQLKRWRDSVVQQSLKNDIGDGLGQGTTQATVSCSESGPCEVSAETNSDEGERVQLAFGSALEKAKEQVIADEGVEDRSGLVLSEEEGADVQQSVNLSPDSSRHEDICQEGVIDAAQASKTSEVSPIKLRLSRSSKRQVLRSIQDTNLYSLRRKRQVGKKRACITDEKYEVSWSNVFELLADFDSEFQSFEEVLIRSQEFNLLMDSDGRLQNFEEVLKDTLLLPIRDDPGESMQVDEQEFSFVSAVPQIYEKTVVSSDHSVHPFTRSEQEAVLPTDDGAESGLLTPPSRLSSRPFSIDVPRREKQHRYKRLSPALPKSPKMDLNSVEHVPDSSETLRPVSPESSDNSKFESEMPEPKLARSVSDSGCEAYCDPRITIRIKRTRRRTHEVQDTVVVLRLKRSSLSLSDSRSNENMESEQFDFAPLLFDYLKHNMHETPEVLVPDLTKTNNFVDRDPADMNELESKAAAKGPQAQNDYESESVEDGSAYQQASRDPSPISNGVDQFQTQPRRTSQRSRGSDPIIRVAKKRVLGGIAKNSAIVGSLLSADVYSDPIIIKIKRDLIPDFVTRNVSTIK